MMWGKSAAGSWGWQQACPRERSKPARSEPLLVLVGLCLSGPWASLAAKDGQRPAFYGPKQDDETATRVRELRA